MVRGDLDCPCSGQRKEFGSSAAENVSSEITSWLSSFTPAALDKLGLRACSSPDVVREALDRSAEIWIPPKGYRGLKDRCVNGPLPACRFLLTEPSDFRRGSVVDVGFGAVIWGSFEVAIYGTPWVQSPA